jgi:2-dehydro-3-deoxyphosphogluconate aldolase / (4S)-4-hydroxy-2-oxoglutarate aldolase
MVRQDGYSGNMKQHDLLELMADTGIIPVFYNAQADISKKIIDACYLGGIRVFEFTNRGPEAFNVFNALVKHASQYKDMALGIGTIMNADDTRKFIDAGAQFIVSPIIKEEMGDICAGKNIPWIPGCATLTEIVRGHEAGAALIKIFPASVLGPAFVEAVRPVIPSIRLMPTGGVDTTEGNLRKWFNSGVHCVGMGSQLLTKDILQNQDWKKLETSVRSTLDIVKTIKQ